MDGQREMLYLSPKDSCSETDVGHNKNFANTQEGGPFNLHRTAYA
jgi:hypothetical protein